MSATYRTRLAVVFVALSLLLVSTTVIVALQVPPKSSRFDALVVSDPSNALSVATIRIESMPPSDGLRVGWEQFRAAHGPSWSVHLDRRSGVPLLVEGGVIPWAVKPDTTVDSLAQSLRGFVAANRSLLQASNDQLVLNREGSGELLQDVWQIVFDRAIAGVPVSGERYLFTIGHGNLISFGTPRWSRIDANTVPAIDAGDAQARVAAYMGLTKADAYDFFAKPALALIALPADASALVWDVKLRVSGGIETWKAQVDAHTGMIVSFVDANQYAVAKGGVYPTTSDQACPDGCEQPNYPMPFTNIVAGSTQFATSAGIFNCSPSGGIALTNLNGKYFRALDYCGDIAEHVTCDADLDLRTSVGTNCTVPAGSAANSGDTHAARTSYFHLNRIAEHVRPWLPNNAWIRSQVDDNVNLLQWCNAFWDGSTVNFFRDGYGCGNTAEIAGVSQHEWGHGLDFNDGGGYDNPSEAYADVTSLLATHVSCMGRGFRHGVNCTGNGFECLECTGVRDLDWDKLSTHEPARGYPWVANCPSFPNSASPCGQEVHCEGYLAGETIWDLAVRDLPASGLTLADSWQLVDKLWYLSRTGSGGNAYNCFIVDTDGCGATNWFAKLRAVDDDDGDLGNGTPHAAAIFAAFDRHGIACGAVDDPSNQSTTICPAIGAPALTLENGNGFVSLAWTPVAGSTGYRVLRNDVSCSAGFTIIGTTTATTYSDTGLGNGFTEYYSIQPLGTNAACDGLLSNCLAAKPAPLAGSVKFSGPSFGCTGVATVTVTDSNIGAPTTTAFLASTTESAPESIALTQIAPGSDTYRGSITLTPAAPAADGLLSVEGGGTITATYLDGNDGAGGVNLPHFATAAVDCTQPAILKVQATNVTGSAAKITWTTNEPASSTVHHGTVPPPGATTGNAAAVVAHGIDINGLAECTPYLYAVDSTDVAGNMTTDDALGAYYAFTTGKTTLLSYGSTDTPIPIPDNSAAGATSTITVTDVRTVQDVNVTINVQHTYDADLSFTLIAPSGRSVLLANPRGGSGDNYTNTVFDDEAAVPLSGPAPFSGTFRPDSPLSVVDGLGSAGGWKLMAVDRSGQDVGTILNWSLQLTYATSPCGPHAFLRSQTRVADTCVTGGAGGANARWDAGEHVQFSVNVWNDGTTALTGVSATVTSSTPGVVMADDTASFPDIPPGGASNSQAPHFRTHLPTAIPCGAAAAFQVVIHADQGVWTGAFTQFIGRATNGTGRVLDESFASGIPAAWTVVDGGSGGGAAATWTAANPGVRTIASPMQVPVATVDSDAAGPAATQDEGLLTPVLDLSTAATATLQFDEFFRWFAGGTDEIADVDVRSSLTGGTWVNLSRQQGGSSANPDHKTIDLSPYAAGAADAQIRFRDWNGANDEYWQIDNVTIDTSAPGSCDMPVCALPVASGAKPVADGTFGAPMKASRGNVSGSTIGVTWDVTTCASADQHILYGNLAGVSSAAVSGAFCNLGTSGAASWTGVPAGDLWFVVVGDDNATIEGSWGTDGVGGQRGGAAASGLCGTTTRDNSGVCP